jgi:acyl carrier protein
MTRPEQLAALQADVDALVRADEATVLAALPQWDSLSILLVVSHFEHVHDREINGAQVRDCRTVADILNLNSPLS